MRLELAPNQKLQLKLSLQVSGPVFSLTVGELAETLSRVACDVEQRFSVPTEPKAFSDFFSSSFTRISKAVSAELQVLSKPHLTVCIDGSKISTYIQGGQFEKLNPAIAAFAEVEWKYTKRLNIIKSLVRELGWIVSKRSELTQWIVQEQTTYLKSFRATDLKPITCVDVAARFELHPSTVSRLVGRTLILVEDNNPSTAERARLQKIAEKFGAPTPNGLKAVRRIPLRSLLPGERGLQSKRIHECLDDLQREDESADLFDGTCWKVSSEILSNIVTRRLGFHVSRRTIDRYREERLETRSFKKKFESR